MTEPSAPARPFAFDVEQALDAGEPVDPSRYYFRTHPVFRTDRIQFFAVM